MNKPTIAKSIESPASTASSAVRSTIKLPRHSNLTDTDSNYNHRKYFWTEMHLVHLVGTLLWEMKWTSIATFFFPFELNQT